jgi:MFS transporter, AAHS family, 4-hydroxybenzoate transporter
VSATERAINVREFIDKRPISPLQWMIGTLAFLVIALDGIDTVIMGFVAPELIKEWGVSKKALGPVLSAALFGLAVGAILGGPIADRIGRKRVLVTSLFIVGIGTLATARAPSLEFMLSIRFLTGIGLGAIMPNVVALWAEYVPERRRSFLVTIVFSGFTAGAALSGFVAAWVIPNYGWRAMVTVGGVLATAFVPLLVLWLPESVAFLAIREKNSALIRKILAQIGRSPLPEDASFFLPAQPKTKGGAIGTVLSRRFVFGTVLIWLCYFIGLFATYLLLNWLPTMVVEAGYTGAQGAILIGLFNWGGTLGSVANGWLMDRWNRYFLVSMCFGLAAASLWMISGVGASFLTLQLLSFAWGWFLPGTNTGMNALTAQFYPTVARATGISWMHAFGRIGAISSAFAGGAMLSAGLGLSRILPALALAPLLGSLAVLLISRTAKRKETADEADEPLASSAVVGVSPNA